MYAIRTTSTSALPISNILFRSTATSLTPNFNFPFWIHTIATSSAIRTSRRNARNIPRHPRAVSNLPAAVAPAATSHQPDPKISLNKATAPAPHHQNP